MALVVKNESRFSPGNDRAGSHELFIGDVTGDAAYPVGGWPLTPAQLGLSSVVKVVAGAAGGYTFWYDATNQKLKAFTTAATEAAANLAGLNGVVIPILAYGRP